MSIDNLKCRTCLSDSTTYYNLADHIDDVECYNILDMLDSIVPHIDIRSSSELSTLVCQICAEKLLKSYKFQQMCIKSNYILQDELSDTMIKVEENIDPLANQNIKQMYDNLDEETNYYNIGFLSNDYANSSIFEPQLSMNELKTRSCTKEDDGMGQKTFQCRYCPKTFKKIHSLAAHCRVHKKKQLPKNKGKTIQSDFDACREMSINLQEKEETDNALQIYNETPKANKNINKRIIPCKICGKIFDRPSTLERHNAVHSLDRPLECIICKYRFSEQKFLKAHMLKHKNGAGLNTIIKDTANSLQIHYEGTQNNLNNNLFLEPRQSNFNNFANIGLGKIKSPNRNTNKRVFPCKICGKVFNRNYSLRRHKSVHSRARPHKCKICKYSFTDEKFLKSHLLKHRNKAELNTILKQHIDNGQQIYSEPTNSNFINSSTIKLGESEFNDSFNTGLEEITRADKNTSKRVFPCKICGKIFKRNYSLRRHKSVHSLARPYKCKICKYGFSDEKLLNNHLQKHKNEEILNTITKAAIDNGQQVYNESTNNNLNNVSTIEPRENKFNDSSSTELAEIKRANGNTNNRVFPCKICGKIFNRNYSLRRHKSVHSLARPYKCKICKYGFSDEKFLKTHLLKHKNEGELNAIIKDIDSGQQIQNKKTNKPLEREDKFHDSTVTGLQETKIPNGNINKRLFPCEICGKTFDRPSTLIRHSSVHSLDRPYECKICKYRFPDQKFLKSHLLKHKNALEFNAIVKEDIDNTLLIHNDATMEEIQI